jgi:hypothetical protein
MRAGRRSDDRPSGQVQICEVCENSLDASCRELAGAEPTHDILLSRRGVAASGDNVATVGREIDENCRCVLARSTDRVLSYVSSLYSTPLLIPDVSLFSLFPLPLFSFLFLMYSQISNGSS